MQHDSDSRLELILKAIYAELRLHNDMNAAWLKYKSNSYKLDETIERLVKRRPGLELPEPDKPAGEEKDSPLPPPRPSRAGRGLSTSWSDDMLGEIAGAVGSLGSESDWL